MITHRSSIFSDLYPEIFFPIYDVYFVNWILRAFENIFLPVQTTESTSWYHFYLRTYMTSPDLGRIWRENCWYKVKPCRHLVLKKVYHIYQVVLEAFAISFCYIVHLSTYVQKRNINWQLEKKKKKTMNKKRRIETKNFPTTIALNLSFTWKVY